MAIQPNAPIRYKHMIEAGFSDAKLAYEILKVNINAGTTPDFSDGNIYADKFTTNTGYMNSINTGATNSIFFQSSRYIVNFTTTLYDDFEDGVIDTTKWTTSTWAGGTVSETDGVLRLSKPSSGGGGSATATSTSSSTVIGIFGNSFSHDSPDIYETQQIKIYLVGQNGTYEIMGAVFCGSETSSCSGYNNFVSNVTCMFIKNENKIYLLDSSGGIIRSISISSTESGPFQVKFYVYDNGPRSGYTSYTTLDVDYVNFGSFVDSVVQTNTLATSSTGFEGLYIYADADIPTGTSITVDISTDGGNNWVLTDQPVNSYIDIPDTDTGTDLVLRFNLKHDGAGSTPSLYGYAIKYWTK